MRRRLCLAMLVAVVAGAAPAAGAPAAPRTTKYFLHIDIVQPGVGEPEYEYYMDTADYPDTGDGTGNTANGLLNEVFGATGIEEPRRDVFSVRDRLPLRLDASRPVTGRIAVEGFEMSSLGQAVPVGAGQSVLDLELVGTPSGTDDPVTIGSQTVEFLVTPIEPQHVVEVSLDPDDSLRGTTFSEVELIAYFRGASVLTGFYELDDPASYIEIPTLRPARA